MGIDTITSQVLAGRFTKPRVGQTVVYYIDGPSDGRTAAAKITRVIDRATVELKLVRDGTKHTATWANVIHAPRPAGSWDFIV